MHLLKGKSLNYISKPRERSKALLMGFKSWTSGTKSESLIEYCCRADAAVSKLNSEVAVAVASSK